MMKRLGMRTMMRLCDLLIMKTYQKGSLIHDADQPDDTIYFIKKGHVRIVKENESGERVIIHALGRGHIFGETRLMEIGDEKYFAEAMSETQICFIEAERMKQLLIEYPKLHNAVIKTSWLKVSKLERRLEDVLYKDTRTRIVEFLQDYVKENGKEQEDRHIAPNIFSHKDIAKLTSTTRQTVNNTLSKLRNEGVLIYNSREISFPGTVLQEEMTKDESHH